jgi:hypothetical protein
VYIVWCVHILYYVHVYLYYYKDEHYLTVSLMKSNSCDPRVSLTIMNYQMDFSMTYAVAQSAQSGHVHYYGNLDNATKR